MATWQCWMLRQANFGFCNGPAAVIWRAKMPDEPTLLDVIDKVLKPGAYLANKGNGTPRRQCLNEGAYSRVIARCIFQDGEAGALFNGLYIIGDGAKISVPNSTKWLWFLIPVSVP